MTKQEYIEQVYGDRYNNLKYGIDENGFFVGEYDDLSNEEIESWDRIEDVYLGDVKFRPGVLRGIEDNNGWIRINNESDLPDKNPTKVYDCGKLDEFGVFNQRVLPVTAKYLGTLYRGYGCTHYKPFVTQAPPLY